MGSDPRLFDRVCRLTAYYTTTPAFAEKFEVDVTNPEAGVVIESTGGAGQRVEFDIDRNLSKHPNRCQISITNLNESHRSAFKLSPVKVILEAGYKDNVSTVFTGDVTFAVSTLDGPNWVTKLEVGDGDRVYSSARVGKSYKAGTPEISILKDQLESIGQKVPENIRNSSAFKKVVAAGYTTFGPLADNLSELLKPHGYTWSIQDEQVQILHHDETASGVFTLGPEHGMIGSPEFGHPERKKKPPTITVRAALYPQLRPGHPVIVNSRDVQGTFKILKVKHKGDTHGESWSTEVEISAIDLKSDAGKPQLTAAQTTKKR